MWLVQDNIADVPGARAAFENIVSPDSIAAIRARVVPPGTGVILNDSMSHFAYRAPGSVNYVAPGKKPRSTIAPTIVFCEGRPVLAIGLPGGGRIPTAMLQVLLDHLAPGVPLEKAIGDTRVHFERSRGPGRPRSS